MRANVLMYIGLMLMVLTASMLINITAKSAYAEAVRDSVDSALERSMSLVRIDASDHFVMYGLDNQVKSDVNIDGVTNTTSDIDKFKADFIRILSQDLDPKITDLTVRIYGADPEAGLLSVEVIAEFYYSSGGQLDENGEWIGRRKGRVSSYKTMILNKSVDGTITPDS